MKSWHIDQLAFNWVIRTKLKVKYSKPFKQLDRFLYTNGDILRRPSYHAKMGIRPMIAHANYAQGFEKKKAIFVKFNMWYL